MEQPLSPTRRHGHLAKPEELPGKHCQYPAAPFEWTRSEALPMASHGCANCHGAGMRFGTKMRLLVCGCVLRAIFRVCWDKYVAMTTQHRWLSIASVEPHTRRKRAVYGRKAEEYIADFELVSRRVLVEAREAELFRRHWVLGEDWRACSLRLGMNKGNFFHAVYRVEAKLGRAFRELQPYSLFPLDEYFRGGSRMIERPPRLAPESQARPVVREEARGQRTGTQAKTCATEACPTEARGRGRQHIGNAEILDERFTEMRKRQDWNGGRPMPKSMSAGAVAYGD